MIHLGEFIKTQRQIQGFTYRYISEKSGVTQQFIQSIQRGSNCSLEVAEKILNVFGYEMVVQKKHE